MERIEILKTYKIYVGGKFPRTESGRTYLLKDKNNKPLANVCLCSRKDLRDAVGASRSAFGGWYGRAAFNRGQILYRIAEMLEGRKLQFVDELTRQGLTQKEAETEVQLCIDRIVYYSGWCDKFQQIFSAVNPVASSHFNFSVPEATGVVGVICSDHFSLLNLVSTVMPVIAGGNTCVVLASEKMPLCAISFAEVLSTSDLPGGVVNILTGSRAELLPHFSTHMDVNALVCDNLNQDEIKLAETASVGNLKRIVKYNSSWKNDDAEGPYFISDVQEIKTTWHPIENIGGAGGGY